MGFSAMYNTGKATGQEPTRTRLCTICQEPLGNSKPFEMSAGPGQALQAHRACADRVSSAMESRMVPTAATEERIRKRTSQLLLTRLTTGKWV
jgi:hypothetical protein